MRPDRWSNFQRPYRRQESPSGLSASAESETKLTKKRKAAAAASAAAKAAADAKEKAAKIIAAVSHRNLKKFCITIAVLNL